MVYAYRMLAAKEELTPENIRLAHLMGWCLEIVREKCDYLINFANCLFVLGNNWFLKEEFQFLKLQTCLQLWETFMIMWTSLVLG
jgi:hypothetical protein